MIVNTVFFTSQIEIWEIAFLNCSHIDIEILFFASNRIPPFPQNQFLQDFILPFLK